MSRKRNEWIDSLIVEFWGKKYDWLAFAASPCLQLLRRRDVTTSFFGVLASLDYFHFSCFHITDSKVDSTHKSPLGRLTWCRLKWSTSKSTGEVGLRSWFELWSRLVSWRYDATRVFIELNRRHSSCCELEVDSEVDLKVDIITSLDSLSITLILIKVES